MRNYLIILMLVLSSMVSCKSQTTEEQGHGSDKNMPHETITVNKKYDENGNLIAMDSIYTSYYSNFEGDTIAFDSTLDNFEIYFDRHFPSFRSDMFQDADSSLNSDFLSEDFFERQFFDQNERVLRMMRDMDSIKNEFFKQQIVQMDKQRKD